MSYYLPKVCLFCAVQHSPSASLDGAAFADCVHHAGTNDGAGCAVLPSHPTDSVTWRVAGDVLHLHAESTAANLIPGGIALVFPGAKSRPLVTRFPHLTEFPCAPQVQLFVIPSW